MDAQMTKAYLQQTQVYFSDTAVQEGAFLTIAHMIPRQAAAAARRLSVYAKMWMEEAGVEHPHPYVWMTTQPLHSALIARAATGVLVEGN